MIIRKYEERDLIEIVKLFYDTVHIINKKDYNQKQLDAWAPKQYDLAKWNLSLSKSYTLVAVENDKIIGFGNIYPDGYLDCLYVHSEFQNQHIATKICDLLEEKVTGDIIVYASITAKLFFLNRNYESLKENYVEKNGVILKNFLMKKIK